MLEVGADPLLPDLGFGVLPWKIEDVVEVAGATSEVVVDVVDG